MSSGELKTTYTTSGSSVVRQKNSIFTTKTNQQSSKQKEKFDQKVESSKEKNPLLMKLLMK